MINEKIEGKESSIIFSDILEECKHYLKDTISLMEKEEKKAEISNYTKTELQFKNSALSLHNLSRNENLDEEEIISIPHEKIGFISDYCEESREILGNIELQIVDLEAADRPLPIVNNIHKGLINLKDSANALSIRKIAALAAANESLLNYIQDISKSL